MKITGLRKVFSGVSVMAMVAMMCSAATAQDKTNSAADENAEELNEILVTGTRIRRMDVAQSTIEIGRVQIDNRGFTNIAGAFNELPQSSPGLNTFCTTETTFYGDNGGQQFVNLNWPLIF